MLRKLSFMGKIQPVKAEKQCDPLADFKMLDVKCGNVDAFSTAQTKTESAHPETSLTLVQVSSNYPVGVNTAASSSLSNANASSLHTVSIPMESVIFYQISSQTLQSLWLHLSQNRLTLALALQNPYP